MKTLLTFCFVTWISILTSCDLRSGIAKREMEKYELAPTPTIAPPATGTPVNPGDIVEVDINQEGDPIAIDGNNQNKTTACTKFNRHTVNGNDSVVTIKGACRQIMINGDRNKITAYAAKEFVLNGSENIVKYSRFSNGILPTVVDNRGGNVIEKVSAQVTTNQPRNKIVK